MVNRKPALSIGEFNRLWGNTQWGGPLLKLFENHEITVEHLTCSLHEGTVFQRLFSNEQWHIISYLMNNNIMTKELCSENMKQITKEIFRYRKWNILFELLEKRLLSVKDIDKSYIDTLQELATEETNPTNKEMILKILGHQVGAEHSVAIFISLSENIIPKELIELTLDYYLDETNYKGSIKEITEKLNQYKTQFIKDHLQELIDVYILFFNYSAQPQFEKMYLDSLAKNLSHWLHQFDFQTLTHPFGQLLLILIAEAAENGVMFYRRGLQEFVDKVAGKYVSLSREEINILNDLPPTATDKIDSLIPVFGIFNKRKMNQSETLCRTCCIKR